MKKLKSTIMRLILVPLVILLSSSLAMAQTPSTAIPTNGNSTPSTAIPTNGSSGTAAQNNALNIHLTNPLTGVSTIPDAINKFLGIIIRIALPLIILFFIWSGLSFILARGNPEKVKKAKNMFFYTVIGTLLILGAWVITNAIIGTANAIIGK